METRTDAASRTLVRSVAFLADERRKIYDCIDGGPMSSNKFFPKVRLNRSLAWRD